MLDQQSPLSASTRSASAAALARPRRQPRAAVKMPATAAAHRSLPPPHRPHLPYYARRYWTTHGVLR